MRHIFFTLLTVITIASCSTSKENETEQKNWIWADANIAKTEQEWTETLTKYQKANINAILLSANKEVLQRVIPIAHSMNIEIHAWMWTLNRPNDSIALQHPEWYSVNRLGSSCYDNRPYVDYYQWLCPSIPEVQAHILNKVKELLTIDGLDGVHLDYVRYSDVILPKGLWSKYDIVQDKVYPEWDYGYNASNINLFKEKYGYSPLDIENPCLDEKWVDFRLNTVTELVNKIADLVHRHDKQLTAAVFPSPNMSKNMVYQAWDNWNLDAALPMIYHNFYEADLDWIEQTTKDGVQTVKGKFPIYTGLFVPDLKDETLKKATMQAIQGGAKGWSLFDAHAFESIHQSKIN